METLLLPPGNASDCAATTSDADLLARFARGDEPAFAVLIQRHGPMVLGVCRRVLGNHHDAEDAFQATFMLLARKAESIDHPERLGNWLYGVAQRTALKLREMRQRREVVEHAAIATAQRPPQLEGAWQEVQQALDEEIGRLDDTLRSAIILCYLEGKTHEEAARALGRPLGSMSWLLNRALGAVRSGLRKRGITLYGGMPSLLLALQGPLPVPDELQLATLRSLGVASATSPLVVLVTAVLREMGTESTSRLARAVGIAILVFLGLSAIGYQALAAPPGSPGGGGFLNWLWPSKCCKHAR